MDLENYCDLRLNSGSSNKMDAIIESKRIKQFDGTQIHPTTLLLSTSAGFVRKFSKTFPLNFVDFYEDFDYLSNCCKTIFFKKKTKSK